MDDIVTARVLLEGIVSGLRKGLRGLEIDELPIQAHIIDKMCDECEGVLEHGNHHRDMMKAKRALDAAANAWIELRTHLAIAAKALTPSAEALENRAATQLKEVPKGEPDGDFGVN